MKEHAKLYKVQKERTVHQLGKRLQPEEEKDDVMHDDVNQAQKKKRMADGQAQPVIPQQQPMIQPQRKP